MAGCLFCDWREHLPSPALVFATKKGELLGPSVPAGTMAKAVWAIRNDDGEWVKVPAQHWHTFDAWLHSGISH